VLTAIYRNSQQTDSAYLSCMSTMLAAVTKVTSYKSANLFTQTQYIGRRAPASLLPTHSAQVSLQYVNEWLDEATDGRMDQGSTAARGSSAGSISIEGGKPQFHGFVSAAQQNSTKQYLKNRLVLRPDTGQAR